jgi:hypothetical protein
LIVALLSWWDEQPSWLTRTITPLARFAHHVVAVDGAYENMPTAHERPASPGDQADAVVAACDSAGLGLTLHRPNVPWSGDEVAKRTAMFRLADVVCRDGDWLFVIDADEQVQAAPANLDEQLAWCDQHRFTVGAVDFVTPPYDGQVPSRRFFKWHPGLHVAGRHYRYVTGDGRVMWGDEEDPAMEPYCMLNGFRLEHWADRRHPYRREKQMGYYNRRSQLQLEP